VETNSTKFHHIEFLKKKEIVKILENKTDIDKIESSNRVKREDIEAKILELQK